MLSRVMPVLSMVMSVLSMVMSVKFSVNFAVESVRGLSPRPARDKYLHGKTEKRPRLYSVRPIMARVKPCKQTL